eukprot:1092712-Prymnesium_polylepis.1
MAQTKRGSAHCSRRGPTAHARTPMSCVGETRFVLSARCAWFLVYLPATTSGPTCNARPTATGRDKNPEAVARVRAQRGGRAQRLVTP